MSNKISLPTNRTIATHFRQKARRQKRKPRVTLAQRIALRTMRLHAKATAGTTRQKPVAIAGKYRAGFRVIAGRDCFFRSSWEANYARFLESERLAGRILGWAHEGKTFYFPDATRPPRSYTPDFQITMLNGLLEYHEVKGLVDRRLDAILRRMAEDYSYYPLKVLDAARYAELERTRADTIPGWEYPGGKRPRRAKYALAF